MTIPQKGKANGIALEIEGDGRAKRYTITDDLDMLQELQETDFYDYLSNFSLWEAALR